MTGATSELWASAWLSVRVAGAATALAGLAAVPLAWAMSRRRGRGTRGVLEGVLLLPLVLPPTVVGLGLVAALGRRGPAGWLGVPLVFTPAGAVVAAAVVAFPLIYLPSRAAFAAIDEDLLDAARVAGATGPRRLWLVDLPLARRGVLAGLLLGLARALGEFGATLMVLGWQPGRATLPIAVYAAFERGDIAAAAWPALMLAAAALALAVACDRLSR